MPVHYIPRGHVHEDLRSLDHDGELVDSMVPDPERPDTHFLVTTRFKGADEYETRTTDTASRFGGAA